MPVETSLGIRNVSVQPRFNRGQPEINRGIVPEPGQNVIARSEFPSDAASFLEQKRPFIFSLQQQMTIVTEGVKSVRIWAESALGGFKAEVGRRSEKIRSRGGGRRSRCSRCYIRHASGGECRGGIPGSTPSTSSILTSQLLTFSLTPR